MSKKYGDLKNYDIIFQGILKKSPPQKPRAFFNFITKFSCTGDYEAIPPKLRKRWKKRHFVLYKTARPTQVYLLYFKIDPSPECKNIGGIDLVKLSNLSTDAGSEVNKSNVFSIQTVDDKGDQRVYFLCAQSFEMMTLWVEKIVSSLGLNGNSTQSSRVTSYPSPASHIGMKGMLQRKESDTSTPTPRSAIVARKSSSESRTFSFTNTNERAMNNATSSYYNLSPGHDLISLEVLEDPIANEEEDVYKVPYEDSNQHSYANLDDDQKTPSAVKSNLSGDLFFPSSSDNCFHATSVFTPSCKEFKSPVEETIFEYQNLPAQQCNTPVSNITSENRLVYDDTDDFDFPLPTRIRGDTTSSSSSSSNSSNTSTSGDDINNNRFSSDKNPQVPFFGSSSSPPRVPRRLNPPDTNKKPYQPQTVLPKKTMRSAMSKTDSVETSTGSNEESLSALNYVDADNLMLNYRKETKSESGRESVYLSLDGAPSPYNIYPASPMDSRSSDFGSIRGETPSNAEEFGAASMYSLSTGFKESSGSVEYREICDTRTEALLKLNVRIQNNEK